MDCGGAGLSGVECELGRIADAMAGFDWGSFWATLIATVVGAAIALAGSWWLSVLSQKARYQDRLDDRLAVVVERAGEMVLENFKWAKPPVPFVGKPPGPPTGTALASALIAARLMARGVDREILHVLVGGTFATTTDDWSANVEALSHVNDVIRIWREGTPGSADRALAEAKRLTRLDE